MYQHESKGLNKLILENISLPSPYEQSTPKKKVTSHELMRQIKQRKKQIYNKEFQKISDNAFKSRDKILSLPKIIEMTSDSINQEDQVQSTLSRSRQDITLIYHPSTTKSRSTMRPQFFTRIGSRNYQDQPEQESAEEEEKSIKGDERIFRQAFLLVPQFHRQRKMKNMRPLIELVRQYNPLFRHVSENLLKLMIKVGDLQLFEKNQFIYSRKDKLTSVYFILYGKVRVSDPWTGFKKVYNGGETLCQFILFDKSDKQRQQSAKAMMTCYLLLITPSNYIQICEKSVLSGMKAQFYGLQLLMRKNYIRKQSMKKSTLI